MNISNGISNRIKWCGNKGKEEDPTSCTFQCQGGLLGLWFYEGDIIIYTSLLTELWPLLCPQGGWPFWRPCRLFPRLRCSHKGKSKSPRGGETSNFKMHPIIWVYISKLNFNDLLGKCVPLCVSINRSFPCYMFPFFIIEGALKKS